MTDESRSPVAASLQDRPRPTIKRLCAVCRPKLYPGDVAANLVVVSPTGTAHWADGGTTDCGRDATGDAVVTMVTVRVRSGSVGSERFGLIWLNGAVERTWANGRERWLRVCKPEVTGSIPVRST